jgi:hypothetical protein
VFTCSGSFWTQQAKLTAADGVGNDFFGSSVGLSGDGNTAVAGVPSATVGGNENQGAAYVFTRSGADWTQQAKLTAADGAPDNVFGEAAGLSADGHSAIVGAHEANVGGHIWQGAAYMFTRSGADWTQQAKLTAADGAMDDQLGYSVALSSNGNTAIAGACEANVGGIFNQGAAYVFAAGTLQFAASTSSVAETAGSVTVTVTRANSASGAASVNYTTADGTAAAGTDYTAATGTLTWADGDLAGKAIAIPILNRAGAQGSRAFTVSLGGASGAALGTPATATVTIEDVPAPADVSASDGTYLDRVAVSWSAASGATAYEVWRNTVDDSSSATAIATGVAGTGYDDAGAAAGITYYYWVKAVGASGTSGFSASDYGYRGVVGPLITANGRVGEVDLVSGEPVTIAVRMMNVTQYLGTGVDWWVVAFARSGAWYYLDSTMQWTEFSGDLAFCHPAYQGGLVHLDATPVLSGYTLGSGTYDFWFAIDYPMDGILDVNGQILYNRVTVVMP